ncbi:MAG: hypothetical protein R6V03_11255 [Kiritimatiellia bacterium]
MIPGAVYYHPDGRWLWITAQRPTTGMHWDFEQNRQVARFQYHGRLGPSEVVYTPEVSLYWGNGGRGEMLELLNKHFIVYEEPPEWFYHTAWFWLHWWQYRPGGFDDMAEQIRFLNGELGLTGFGITAHDLRPGMKDCGTASLRPSPHLGGERGMRKVGETVRELGGHMYIWMPFLGMGEPSSDMKSDWQIRGEDGRPYTGFSHGSSDTYQTLNFNHPEVQEYYLRWIRRYVGEYHVDGIFWDCGGSPLPPDFSPPDRRAFQRFPAECMVGGYNFMERVMQEGRAVSEDFFMWHECFSQDLPGNGYSTNTGFDSFVMELNRSGPNRLVYRSCSAYNLYGGFPFVYPGYDTVFESPVSIDTYRPLAADPMNRWLVKFVHENGVRQASGIEPGVAVCEGHMVVDPSREARRISVPSWAGRPGSITNVLTGEKSKPESESEAGPVFVVPGGSAYELNK